MSPGFRKASAKAAGDRRRKPGHALAKDPRDLDHRVLWNAGIEEALLGLGPRQVGVAPRTLVRLDPWQSHCAPRAQQQINRQSGFLRHLTGGVAGAEDPLNRQQDQTVLLHSGPQLVCGRPFLGQALQQLEPGGALLALEPVEQSGGREVHAVILNENFYPRGPRCCRS